ncbi:sigma-70 family RNA polymerase sigma factor [Kribbella sp. CA-247076]|uniref:sigma-70 family RNA polymerase sigma factor n=1 Tax=Kribbella sp. CA-247076 TaxID=3239941 RepID=UPI003D9248C3
MNAATVKETLDHEATGAERLTGDLDEAVELFVRARPRLMAIAYRILGSTAEAEDVVQETWLRWQKVDRTIVENPQALLATMTTRLAINVRQSARRRRETPVEAWTPEVVDPADDPANRAERGDAVEQAVALLMARLTPSERAAYVLREAFDYPYRQISEVLHLGAANARQLVCRARRAIADEGRAAVETASHQHLLHAFLTAARGGDFTDLEEVLVADLAS